MPLPRRLAQNGIQARQGFKAGWWILFPTTITVLREKNNDDMWKEISKKEARKIFFLLLVTFFSSKDQKGFLINQEFWMKHEKRIEMDDLQLTGEKKECLGTNDGDTTTKKLKRIPCIRHLASSVHFVIAISTIVGYLCQSHHLKRKCGYNLTCKYINIYIYIYIYIYMKW